MTEPTVVAKHPEVLELEPGTYYWCACGRSARQPFCDGAHKGTGLTPVAFEIQEKQKVALCLCKHSAGKPFCDGSHKGL